MYMSSEFGPSGGGSASRTSRCLCSRPFCGMPKTKLSLRLSGDFTCVAPCWSCSEVSVSSEILCLRSACQRYQAGALLGDIQGRRKDFRIGSAAAQVAAHCVLHVAQVWIWIAFQQGGTAHHHARSAEAALYGIMLYKGCLDGMHLLAVRQALDGGDLAARGIDRQRHAGERGRLVDPDCACRTRAAIATHLGSR